MLKATAESWEMVAEKGNSVPRNHEKHEKLETHKRKGE